MKESGIGLSNGINAQESLKGLVHAGEVALAVGLIALITLAGIKRMTRSSKN
jgi:hypothetical protein